MSDLLVAPAFNLSNQLQALIANFPQFFYQVQLKNGQGPSVASQTGTTVTDNNATFLPSMVGGQIIFAENTTTGFTYATITAVPTSTTLTVNVSQTVAPTQYIIWYGGTQLDALGTLSYNQAIVGGVASNARITVDAVIGFAALASAGKFNLIVAPTTTAQWYVRDIKVNYSAAGLSGGGDRLLKITDGTTIYNNAGITAALLGTPINTGWGGTGNPLAGTVAQNTLTAAGANIYAQYAGGTTDYTAGSVSISVTFERAVY